MSLASTLRPVSLAFNSPLQSNISDSTTTDIPFQSQPTYLQLQRMLTRYQNLILLVSSAGSQGRTSPYDLTPTQRQIRAELYSSLPYHRIKWLRTVESARNLLLNLERQAQIIKNPRAKKDALRDLVGKRQIIKRLRNRIEEIGREVEASEARPLDTNTEDDDKLLGERADAVLARMGRDRDIRGKSDKAQKMLKGGKPISDVSEQIDEDEKNSTLLDHPLFDSSLRRRRVEGERPSEPTPSTDSGATSGFSNLPQTERSLQGHAREHEDLTSALVSMAAQLKQQSRAFQFSLKQDENILNRAVSGLDLNITSMEAASKNMAFLRRMSEEQGWFGRLKLYLIIVGLWIAAFLLVFVGPKLRF